MTQEFNVTDLEDVFSLTRDNAETYHEYYIIIVINYAYFKKKRFFRIKSIRAPVGLLDSLI